VRRAALTVAAALGAVGACAPAAPAARVLVAVEPGHPAPAGARFVAAVGPARAYALAVPRHVLGTAYAARMRRRTGILAAQVDERLYAQQSQVGGFCADRPPSTDTSVPNTVASLGVSVPTTPPVAILDTGVDANVPELQGRLVAPFNALDGSTNVSDQDGHGTQVAAMAAAAPGLFAGVSPSSPIMPIRIFGVGGDSTAQILVKGIEHAIVAHAGVINISGANPEADVGPGDVSVVQMAIDDAYEHGILVVAAAGNEGKWQPDVPEAIPHVLSVGATDSSGQRAAFSNSGPWLDLMAPGAGLTLPSPSSVCSSGYGVATGTSFSAPAVAGGIALIRQLRPSLSAEQIFALARQTATDMAGPGHDDETGFGLLNVARAVSAPVPAVDLTELDDDVIWVTGQYAARHPPLLRKSRVQRVKASVSPAKDPQDVYPVILRKGQLLTIRITGGADALLDTNLWDPKTGPMDISNGKTTHEVADYQGLSNAPQISYRVRISGRYFVAVGAADVPDPPSDPAQAPPVVANTEPYQLTVSVRNPLKKRSAKRRRKSTSNKQ
jgi:subtilisin family serine protease